MLQLTVEKEEYTPRDKLLQDRDTYVLTLTATVDNNSYLCSSAFPIEISDYSIIIRRKIKELRSQRSINYHQLEQQIESLAREFRVKKNEGIKVFSKINDKYVIPASSLKGAIRSRIEYKFVPREGKIKSCYRVDDDFFRSQAVNHSRFWGDDILNRRGSCNPERDNNRVCIVCDMFGAPSLASLVSISDAYLKHGESERLTDLGGIEAIKSGAEFETTIVCRNFDYIRLGLIFLGLELYSKSPILLGMYKYKFNRKIGKRQFKEKYAFGLVKFNLIKVYSIKQPNIDINDIISRSKMALEKEFGRDIDWNKGVM